MNARFAFSPSSNIRLLDLKCALISYIIANKNNGNFIVRIDDTNQDIYNVNFENNVYKVLDIFGIKYNKNLVFIQSNRMGLYKKYIDFLINNKNAYPCFCLKQDILKKRIESQNTKQYYKYDGACRDLPLEKIKELLSHNEKYTIRQKMPLEGTVSFHDEIYGDITFKNEISEDQILVRSNGMPTYNLCNVIDDGNMNISVVVRSNEYISSMPKYLNLYDVFNFDIPKFIHLPRILNDKYNVVELLNLGYTPLSIINYLIRIDNTNNIYDFDEIIEKFDLKILCKRNCNFDIKQLNFYNRCCIKKMKDEDYLKFIMPFVIKYCNMNNKSLEFVNLFLLKYKNRISNVMDLINFSKIYFEDNIKYDANAINYIKNNENIKNIVLTFKEEINKISNWDIISVDKALNNVISVYNISKEKIYMPIRIAISGKTCGINLVDMIHLIGKEKIINRLG